MASALKQTTNLTGLAVLADARKRLIVMYGKILKELSKMPESAAYRKNTEELVKYRLSVVEKEVNEQAIEEKIGSGQIEEIFLQAKNELNLTRKLAVFKPWEPLISQAPSGQWKWPPK